MRILAGTSGYAYKEWKGVFYPERIAPAAMLGFYAERLPAVEINATFYRMPRASVLEGWAEAVPEGFRFALKASRRITHQKRLKDADEETGYLVRTAATLGAKLGALLFQLPPNLRADRDRLARFLDAVPPEVPAAFEFRHPSWHEPALVELLRERGRTLVVADADDSPAEGLVATAPRGYLRLRRARYERAELAAWVERIGGAGFESALVFFKHEDAGAGPVLAARLLELAAESAKRPLRARRRPARSAESA
jgi:uncharacterized protein YecE (DUF72 family)